MNRPDGKLVKNVDAMYTLAPYLMRTRSDGSNSIKITIPYEPIHSYCVEQRKKGNKISHMSVILAAFVRVIGEFPFMNRFIVNSRIYARNELTVGMVVLRPEGGDKSMSKMKFDLFDTIYDVNDKVMKYIDDNNKVDSQTNTDDLFDKLTKFPALMRITLWAYRFLDKHNILPKSLIDASPFHNTFTITNLASIRTNFIYHHVYDFGTTSYICAMGNNEEVVHVRGDKVTSEKVMPMGFVMDERIGSGHEYAMVFEKIQKYLKNPELLETAPESVKVDYEFPGLSKRFEGKKVK